MSKVVRSNELQDRKEARDFVPECEVFWEGGEGPAQKQNGCPKNPGHEAFIPVDTLTVQSLPPGSQTQENLDIVRYHCDRTVKITVKSTSANRPDTWPGRSTPYPYNYLKGSNRAWRVGTGDMVEFETKNGLCPCQCHLCGGSKVRKAKKYMEVSVATASHVIYDDVEASSATLECFYDSNDGTGVKLLYGIGMDKENDGRDEL